MPRITPKKLNFKVPAEREIKEFQIVDTEAEERVEGDKEEVKESAQQKVQP